MRTAIIITVGFIMWALLLGAAKVWGAAVNVSMRTATLIFALLWFIAAAFNLWFGVQQAGYAFREELPIFLLIFALPVGIALFVKWKCLGA